MAQYQRNFETSIGMSNRNFQKIVSFYLFECPVAGKSKRGRKFDDYGIKGQAAFARLKKAMLLNATTSLQNNYLPCRQNELSSAFERVKSIAPTDEYCVFLKYDEKTVMQSLYSAIRNAFANGSFSVKTYSGVRIYFFANFDGYLKAEIILHEDTLLSWIDCIKSFE